MTLSARPMTSVRRVAHVTPFRFDTAARPSGGERYARNLARAVAADSHWAVDLISHAPIGHAHAVRVPDTSSRQLLPADLRKEPGSWGLLDALLAADLVHIHAPFTRSSEVTLVMAKVAGKPVCITDHGAHTSRLGSSLGALDLVDRVVAQSAFAAATMTAAPDRVSIAPGGVDDTFFTSVKRRLTREHVLFVGPLLPRKGIDQLIRATPEAVSLVICGRPEPGEYRQRLDALAAGRRVTFVTDADDRDLRALYRRAIAVVLPSVYRDCFGTAYEAPELMGLALLEGMACGSPVICSRVGGMPEFVEHGVTGYVYDDAAGLTDAITRLNGDRELADRLGRAGQQQVRQRWGLTAVGAALSAIYDELFSAHAVVATV